MWNEFVRYALTKYPDQPFPEPQPLVDASTKPMLRGVWQGSDPVRIDVLSGNPVSADYTGPTKLRITNNVHDTLYWVSKDDPLGPSPLSTSQDPQFARWEYGARRWATQNGFVDGGVTTISNP
jgi:hypothetical protein